MDFTLEKKKLDECLLRLDVTLSEETSKELKSRVISRLKNTIKIPGYRPGRIPDEIILTRFRNLYRDELSQLVINLFAERALDEAGIKHLFNLDIIRFGGSDRLTFSMSLEVPPELDFNILKGEKVSIKTRKYDDSLLEERIRDLQYRLGKYEKVDEPIGDSHVVDVLYKWGDQPPKLMQVATFIEQEGLTSEIHNSIKGRKRSDKFEIEVKGELLGLDPETEETIDIEIVEVYRATIPEIDDELAKTAGYEDLKTLKEMFRNKIQHELDRQNRTRSVQNISLLIHQKTGFRIPDQYYESRLYSTSVNFFNKPPADLNYFEKNLVALFSKNEVITDCVFYSYIQQEDIQLHEEELKEQIKLLASFDGISPDLKRAQMDRDRLTDRLKKDLLFFKALDHMKEKYSLEIVEEEEDVSDSNSG